MKDILLILIICKNIIYHSDPYYCKNPSVGNLVAINEK